MPGPEVREVEHEITVAAPAKDVYQLLVEVEDWPAMFPPSVHVERVEQDGEHERIRICATANGAAKRWTSIRRLLPDQGVIEFRQEKSSPPVAGMGGTWIVEPQGDELCRVRLLHDYRAVDDDPAALQWIAEAVDRNSHAELAALKTTAELGPDAAQKPFTFEDGLQIAGTAADVFAFIDQAQLWSERLPHVARVILTEETEGLQLLEMDTRSPDGSIHTTKSVRVCQRPAGTIHYKQIKLPALMTLHTGRWSFEENADGVLAVSRHTVAIDETKIAQVLGEGAGLAEARAAVRRALGTNSLSTLNHAKAHVEGGS
ncbi:aromatase/cyclase [Streptomyces sp. NPDC047315]|uniref:Putative aromatase/cyclase n=1 Tax=Streptomyces ravidus TaxID=691266 RepID=D1H0K2_9ACTN|nr:putative aromatase/cyclase [Streptomyces ravidus]